MDQKGYVISGLSFLLIIPAIYLVVVFADMAHTGSQSQALLVQSDVVFSTSRDIDKNLPLIAVNVLNKTANNVISSGNPLPKSRTIIKNSLQGEIDNLTKKYSIEGINATCMIISVDSHITDPFKVQINSTISINKGNVSHVENLSHDVSIIGIRDPLPFIKLKNFGGVTIIGNRINYGQSLVNYLIIIRNTSNLSAALYENATSPLTFKRCPYDPYKSHGVSHGPNNLTNLKNCIDNGFFHNSRTGACFLCRLEGRALCPRLGVETFIIPFPSTNNHTNYNAPNSIDHVIFGNFYKGHGVIYHSNITHFYKLYLHNADRSKYGLRNHTV